MIHGQVSRDDQGFFRLELYRQGPRREQGFSLPITADNEEGAVEEGKRLIRYLGAFYGESVSMEITVAAVGRSVVQFMR